MKRIAILAITILTLGGISACKKNTQVLTKDTWPQSWVLVFDNGSSQFFKLVESGGNVILRTDIAKSGFDRNSLAASSAKACEWEVKMVNDAQSIVSIQLKRNPSEAWAVASEVHPTTNEVFWYLRARTISTTPGSKDWQFVYRNRGTTNGVKTITLESVEKPGYFVTNAPTASYGNGVRLILASGTESSVQLLQY